MLREIDILYVLQRYDEMNDKYGRLVETKALICEMLLDSQEFHKSQSTVKKKSFIWEILVPTLRNNKPVRLRHHKQWDKYVKKITGGLTITPPGKGYWVDPDGLVVEERVIPVRIMCTVEEINQIANFTARHYNQDAVMFYLISNDVHIIDYDSKNNYKQIKETEL